MNGKHDAALRMPTWRGLAPKALILGLLALLGTVEAGWGQPPVEPPSTNQKTSNVVLSFDFSPPGARSLGMGGAFLGLADDATAAYTNPAGLTNLALGGPEVAMELRSRNVTEFSPTGGHVFGEASRIGLDTDTPFLQQDEGQTTGFSFLSVGYVLPGGASLALYRHELLSFQMRSESQGFFFGPHPYSEACAVGGICGSRLAASQTVKEATVVNLGLAGAYQVQVPFTPWQDSLSLGVGVSLYQLDLLVRSDYYGGQFPACRFDPLLGWLCLPNFLNVDRGPDGFFGPNQFLSDRYQVSKAEVGDDTDVRFSLGVLWKLGEKEQWRVGGAYRQGPRFSTEQLTLFDAEQISDPEPGSFTVPDSFGVGVAYSTNEGRTKVALDYNRIRYSQRYAELVGPIQGDLEELQEALPTTVIDPRFELEDSDQFHLGFEQIFPIVEPALIGTVRLGAWREPFHEPAYVGRNTDFQEAFNSSPQKAQNHFAVGFGLVFKESIQLDFAADFSDLRDVVSVSFVKFL